MSLGPFTDDDAANLTTAFHARALRSDLRIVLRLFDPDLAARLDRALGDYRSRSVSSLAAPSFAAAAVGWDAEVDEFDRLGAGGGEEQHAPGSVVLAEEEPHRRIEGVLTESADKVIVQWNSKALRDRDSAPLFIGFLGR